MELLDEPIKAQGVVHPLAVALDLVLGEVPGDGLAVELGGPLPVGAVEARRLTVATAARRAAVREALDDAAADHEAELGQFLSLLTEALA